MATMDMVPDSGIEAEDVKNLHLNSASYGDKLVLRMLFSVNGRSARISGTPSAPQLSFTELDVNVNMSEVIKACTNILYKQSFNHRSCNMYLDDQCPLFSFQYQPGLVKRLQFECDDIAKDVSMALKGVFKRSVTRSIRVETSASLYLISSCAREDDNTPEVTLVTTDNAQQCDDRLEQSKLFHFSSSMFAETDDRAKAVPAAVTFNSLSQMLLRTSDQWQVLGIYLNIPGDCLRKIKNDPCNETNDKRLFCMLEYWCHNSHPSWLAVMFALNEIGRRDITKEISTKYHIKCPRQTLQTKVHEKPGETTKSCNTAILDLDIRKFERLCERLENERDELRKDLVHEKRKVKHLSDVQHDYTERIKHREDNIDMKTQELERCEEFIKTLSLQMEQNEQNICSLENSLKTTNGRLKATKIDLDRALKELSVKLSEPNNQDKRMTGLEEAKVTQIDQPKAEQKFNMDLVYHRKLRRTKSQWSTTVVERKLSLANKEMDKLGNKVYTQLEERRKLEEEIDDTVRNLTKKRLTLCEVEGRKLSIDLQTQADELASSLNELITREREANVTLSKVQNEFEESMQETVNLKQILVEKIDSENHVRVACLPYSHSV